MNKFILFQLNMRSCRALVVFALLFSFLAYLFFVLGNVSVGGPESGNDSNYYHLSATGLTESAVNAWPILLRHLNDFGIYHRQAVSVFLYVVFVSVALLTPKLFVSKSVSGTVYQRDIRKRQYLLGAFLLIYPSFFYYTTDIYRDVFMVGLFIFLIFLLKNYYESHSIHLKMLLAVLFFMFCFYLYQLRPYLGFAVAVAFFFPWHLKGWRLFALLLSGLLALMVLKTYGVLDPILRYRGEFGFSRGGSTLGIGLLNTSGLEFLGLFLWSAMAQLFGLFLNSPKALFVFVVESVPFLFLLAYVLRNRQYMDRFCLYLFYFFLIYGLVWILGNDNLGTAVRLRLFNYIAIFIIAIRIYSLKRVSDGVYSLAKRRSVRMIRWRRDNRRVGFGDGVRTIISAMLPGKPI